MGECCFAAFAVASETAGGCASPVDPQATRGEPVLGGYLVREFGHGHTASAMFPAGAAGRQTAHRARKVQLRHLGQGASGPIFWLAGVHLLVGAF